MLNNIYKIFTSSQINEAYIQSAATNKKWAEEKWHISCQSYFWIQPSKTVLASKAYNIVQMMTLIMDR